jgi:GH15 family glucan-1,4-alpha-glucosidase
MDGSIDWCCLPHFDSPSIFAAILDEKKGGFFKIASLHEAQHKQMYLPDSNVLVTRFLSRDGVGEVVDFMPVQDASRGRKTRQIVRVVRAVRGAVRFRLECQPAFDYGRRPHQVTLEGRGAVFESSGMRLSLVSRFPLARQGTGVATEFLLHPGEPSTFILRQVEGDGDSGLEARLVGIELLTQTVGFWRRWLSKYRYHGRWREMVNRSVLVLKMLTFAPTGAIVAAPACSLPEEIGGVRNPGLSGAFQCAWPNVPFGSSANISQRSIDVRFAPESKGRALVAPQSRKLNFKTARILRVPSLLCA